MPFDVSPYSIFPFQLIVNTNACWILRFLSETLSTTIMSVFIIFEPHFFHYSARTYRLYMVPRNNQPGRLPKCSLGAKQKRSSLRPLMFLNKCFSYVTTPDLDPSLFSPTLTPLSGRAASNNQLPWSQRNHHRRHGSQEVICGERQ